jgi:MYXO-CTERM domain-containing protein
MNFIERLFGFSPDGGTSLTEVCLFLLPVLAGLLFLYRRRRQMSAD